MLKKILSYALGFTAGLLAVAPPIGYEIPLMINSYYWLYLVIASGLLGMHLLSTQLPISLKILSVYLFAACFISEVPYASFNAYILVVAALYCYLGFLKSDYSIVLGFVSAAFILEMILTIAQLFGHDTLMNFNRPERLFLGTIMQYMRFSSLLAVMVPLLIIKSKKFLFPIIVFCILSHSSTFALALAAGWITYVWVSKHKYRWGFTYAGMAFAVGYLLYDFESLSAELRFGRWTVWPTIIKSNLFDTKLIRTLPISGPFDLKALVIGRGLDTFMPMFPLYKWDPNPFPQAHNSWLQINWELGLIGSGAIISYLSHLIWRIRKEAILIAGLVCLGVVMFFTFPDRMTQTMMFLVAYIAYCEQKAREIANA